MKLKISLLLLFLFAFCQFAAAQDKTVNIECELTINETEWVKDSQLTAQLTLINNSGKEIEIRLAPNFRLDKQDVEVDTSKLNFGVRFISDEKEKDHIVIKKETTKTKITTTYRTRQFFKFLLKTGESKTVSFILSNLGWKDLVSSTLNHYDWYQKIPNGNYNLYYEWGYYLDKEKKTKRLVSIISNKVEVKLKGENK